MRGEVNKTKGRRFASPTGAMRAEINLGRRCNNNCVFCSEALLRGQQQQDNAGGSEADTRRFLFEIMQLYKQGCRHLTFLGGEPTIRSDFLQLVRTAKKLGYETIFLTSNGRRLADDTYIESLYEAGLNRLYLSLHGHDAKSHDAAVRSPGAFDQVMSAVANLKRRDMPFSLTSVIHRGNLPHLPRMMAHQLALLPRRIMWAFVRPVGAARERFDEIVPGYEELDGPLREALKAAADTQIPVTVAHLPLCRLEGMEKYSDELYWGRQAVAREVERHSNDLDAGGPGRTLITRGHHKVKHPDCGACRYREVCEGVHAEYAKRRGFSEFRPVTGELVQSPEELTRIDDRGIDGR